MSYVPKISMRKEVGGDIRSVLNAPDRAEGRSACSRFALKNTVPLLRNLAHWMEQNVPQSLSYSPHRRSEEDASDNEYARAPE